MHYRAVARAIFKTASFEEALINGFRVYPILYDMPLKDCKSEIVKANVWEKNCEVSGDNVSFLLTFSTSKNFALINRPFPRFPKSLFQSESKCEISVMVISSNFNMNKN